MTLPKHVQIAIAIAIATVLLGDIPAQAYAEQGSAYYRNMLRRTLLGAGARADIVKAKKIADQARNQNIPDIPQRMLDAVDVCYTAGKPRITAREKTAITQDMRVATAYSPNANMRFATGFANGWGVKQDFRRAAAFACHANTVPMELVDQIGGLKLMETWAKSGELPQKLNGQAFTFCTFAVSAQSYARCAAHAKAIAGPQHDADGKAPELVPQQEK